MISVLDLTRVNRLLCLGAHCDDIEIGAGGMILQLAKVQPELEVKWVVFAGEDPERVEEARRSAEVFLAGASKAISSFMDSGTDFSRSRASSSRKPSRTSRRASCRTSS